MRFARLKSVSNVLLFGISLSIVFGGNARAKSESFSFIVMGDSRPIMTKLPQSPPFKRILWETDLIGPNLAIHVGDLVFGYGSQPSELKRQYKNLHDTLSTVRTPMYYAIGNHEVGSGGGEALYEKNVGKEYFSFAVKTSHFIILDSDWGSGGDTGTLGSEQIDWLKKDLESAATATNIFVFMHKPMFENANSNGSSWANLSERDAVHQMFLKAGNVKAVFAGHIHIYDTFTKDGIPYYITGGAGAETTNPEHGGFYHYLLVLVRGKSFEVRVVEPYHIWYDCTPECNGKNKSVKVEISNSLGSNMPLSLRGVTVLMPKLSKNRNYKPFGARILQSTDNGDGTVTLRMSAIMNSPVGYKYFTLEPGD